MLFRKRRAKQKAEEFLRDLERQQAENTDRIAREVCAIVSQGSHPSSLQFGSYITSKDMDDLQQELVDYFLKNRKTESA